MAKQAILTNPLAPVEVVPLGAHDGMQSSMRSVRMENPEDPNGLPIEVGTVGPNYMLMPNIEIYNLARELMDASKLRWRESREVFTGSAWTYTIVTDEVQREVVPGDYLNLGLMFRNSYNGECRASVQVFVERLVCSNGMVVPQYFNALAFRHNQGAVGWQDQITASLDYLHLADGNFDAFTRGCAALAGVDIGIPELSDIRGNHLMDKNRVPQGVWAKMIDRFLLSEEKTGWGLMNAGTNITWHGEKLSQQNLVQNEFLIRQMMSWALGTQYIANHAKPIEVGRF